MRQRIRHKFGAKRTKRDGQTFDSQKEGRYYDELKLRVLAGDVLFFLMQVPFHLPGGVKVVVDFVEFWKDGTVHIIDVKGHKTPQYIRNKKMVETIYPIEIEER